YLTAPGILRWVPEPRWRCVSAPPGIPNGRRGCCQIKRHPPGCSYTAPAIRCRQRRSGGGMGTGKFTGNAQITRKGVSNEGDIVQRQKESESSPTSRQSGEEPLSSPRI